MKRLAISLVLLFQPYPTAAADADAVAFVTSVEGKAVIERRSGDLEAAALGSQLFRGDRIKAVDGPAALVYLSGKSETVKAGKSHKIGKSKKDTSELMGRVLATLGEVAGPQSEANLPQVHGMARDLRLAAEPSNTRLATAEFSFAWNAVPGVDEYEFSIVDKAGKKRSRYVKDNVVRARDFFLKPGERYSWSVRGRDSLVPTESGSRWIYIATADEVKQMEAAIAEVERDYAGPTQRLLKAMAYCDLEFFHAAQELILQLPVGAAEQNRQILHYVNLRMEQSGQTGASDEN